MLPVPNRFAATTIGLRETKRGLPVVKNHEISSTDYYDIALDVELMLIAQAEKALKRH